MTQQPASVSDLFPSRWLTPDDLPNPAGYVVTIDHVEMVQVYDRQTRAQIWKAAVAFRGAKKMMLINKTQGLAIAAIAGSQEFALWQNIRIRLSAGHAPNGKPTILVAAPAAAHIPE